MSRSPVAVQIAADPPTFYKSMARASRAPAPKIGETVQIGNGAARWHLISVEEDIAVLHRVASFGRVKTRVSISRIHTPHEIEILQRDAARAALLDIQRLHRGRETVSPYNPRNKETRCVECQKVHPCPSWLAVEKLKERA